MNNSQKIIIYTILGIAGAAAMITLYAIWQLFTLTINFLGGL